MDVQQQSLKVRQVQNCLNDMLKVSWLPTAANDLANILAYIDERSPSAARDIRQRIEHAVLPVAEHPYLYKRGRVPGTREIVAHPNFIIVYRATNTSIEVINVLHARQQYPSSFELQPEP